MKPVVSKALAVGVLTAVVGATFLIVLTFIRTGGYSERDSYLVHAYFKDATGLTWKSKLQIAGIQVGEVVDIGLEGPRARLDIRVKEGIELHKDACFTKTYPSALLPDAVLEAMPGSPETPILAELPEAEREVTCVREAATVQQVTDMLAAIAKDVQTITGDLAATVSGGKGSMREIVENLASVTRQIDEVVDQNSQRLSDILENTRGFTGDLAEISARDKDKIHAIARNIEELTARLNVVLASVQDIVDPGSGGAGPPGKAGPGGAGGQEGTSPSALAARQTATSAEARGVRQAVEKLSTSLEKLDGLMAKVNDGKSVAGKLLVDERLGRQVGTAIEGLSDYVDRLTKLQVQLNLRSEWLLNQTLEDGRPGTKIYFGARLLPRPDKFYLIEVVSDPRGVDTVTTETVTTETGTTRTTKRLNEEKLTFSAQIGKRYGPITFRAGIIEGSGGIGSDLHLMRDRLQLSASLYQFSRAFQTTSGSVDQAVYPRAKVWLNYYFWDHFYMTTGADDFLNSWETGRYPGGRRFSIGTDLFFGGGVYFTDDDIKTLLGSVGGAVSTN